jgi:hypothetical protein
MVLSPSRSSTTIIASWFVTSGTVTTSLVSTPSDAMLAREKLPVSSPPTLPTYFAASPNLEQSTIALAA